MRHGSLFSGIGGFDLAAEWMGWENVFHCEWNEFGQKILKHYWPNAISYHDITKTDFTIHRGSIDILTGGFPCQPYSMAGKRKGKEDERHLWPEMRRAIKEIQPRWVVGENVYGIVNWSGGLVFHEVQTDLEVEGYEVFPYVLPACGVGADHKRERAWFVAYRDRASTEHAVSTGRDMPTGILQQNAANANESGLERRQSQGIKQKNTSAKRFGQEWIFANAGSSGWENSLYGGGPNEQRPPSKLGNIRQEQHTWWQNFPTQPPLCSGDDGLPSELDGITFSKWRNESIKAYGNAVVPQIPFMIFQTIQEFEKN